MTTSLAFPAYTVNMLDIAPRYASIIMGICNTIGTTAGFVSPTVVGFITQHQVGISQSPYRVLSYSFLGSPLENVSHEGRVEGRGRLFIPRSTQLGYLFGIKVTLENDPLLIKLFYFILTFSISKPFAFSYSLQKNGKECSG